MKSIKITAKSREGLGKTDTRNLRKNSNVPCVLYGFKKENIHFYAHENEFRHAIYTPEVYLIDLEIDGTTHKAIIQGTQFHPVTDKLLHIDFLAISDDAPTMIHIPVKLTGNSPGVLAGGKLALETRRLHVKGIAKNFPEFVTVDVSDLGLGKTIKIRDLEFENLELLDPRNSVVASVKLTRAAKGAAADEEEGEEEGEDTTTESES